MRFRDVLLPFMLVSSSTPWAQMLPERLGNFGTEQAREVLINNRVLACPNGKPLSVLDLTRKLDVMFMQQYPEYAQSIETRFQFYQAVWRPILDQMINNELILADAEEREIKVPDGEIHRELEEMFGPDVVGNLDRLGISYDEAWEMVEKDLIVTQMRGHMVLSRAFSSVAPSMVAEAYDEYAQQAGGQDRWLYRVLSIRHPDREVAATIAQMAEELIGALEACDLERVMQQLEAKKHMGVVDSRAVIGVTALQERTLDSLASSHRDALVNLEAGSISEPKGQVSRHDRCMVYRIFHLVDLIEQPPPPFKEVEASLQQNLFYESMKEHQDSYIQRLRTDYGVTDDYLAQMIPEDFQPYSLR